MFSNIFRLVFGGTIDMMETRTIYEQLRLKLCKNLRTTSLDQNLLVLIKKKHVVIVLPTKIPFFEAFQELQTV